jgi:hypothetical protein
MVGGGHRTLTSLRSTDFRISYGLRRLFMRVRAGASLCGITAGIWPRRNEFRQSFCEAAILAGVCPTWVNGVGLGARRPLPYQVSFTCFDQIRFFAKRRRIYRVPHKHSPNMTMTRAKDCIRGLAGQRHKANFATTLRLPSSAWRLSGQRGKGRCAPSDLGLSY